MHNRNKKNLVVFILFFFFTDCRFDAVWKQNDFFRLFAQKYAIIKPSLLRYNFIQLLRGLGKLLKWRDQAVDQLFDRGQLTNWVQEK